MREISESTCSLAFRSCDLYLFGQHFVPFFHISMLEQAWVLITLPYKKLGQTIPLMNVSFRMEIPTKVTHGD